MRSKSAPQRGATGARAIRRVALATLITGVTGACEAGDRADPADGAPEAQPLPAMDLPACEPTVASLRENIFSRACQEATCHGPGTPAWELHLTDDESIRGLIGQRAASCPPWLLVVPGKPGESYLYQKVLLDRPPCGDRMPWAFHVLPPHSMSCIHDWIAALEGVDGGIE